MGGEREGVGVRRRLLRGPGGIFAPLRGLGVVFVLLQAACDPGASTPSAPSGGSAGEMAGAVAFLGTPIGGLLNRDIFYGALVDDELAAEVVFTDYQCLGKTVDGHRGTDILLPDFRAMDAGVAVLAPAPGTVIDVQDGLFDRNVTLEPERSSNGVVLEHPNGFVSVYLHLRRNSVAVEVGQVVAAGDTLGLVGSSGNSNWPHLHFEIGSRETGVIGDPWEGPCGTDASLWEDQLPYQNEFRLVDAGLTDVREDDRVALLERPPALDSVSTAAERLTFWAILHNARGQPADFEVVGPDGTTVLSRRFSLRPSFSLDFTTVSFPVAGVLTVPGPWRVRFSVGTEVNVELGFRLVAAEEGAAARAGEGVGRVGRPGAAGEMIRVGGWTAADGPAAADGPPAADGPSDGNRRVPFRFPFRIP